MNYPLTVVWESRLQTVCGRC